MQRASDRRRSSPASAVGGAEAITSTDILRFGALLRRYRLAAGLTQEALAERAGLSARAVSDLERDAARLPRLETVALLGKALALKAAELTTLRAAARPVDDVALRSAERPTESEQKIRGRLPTQLTSFVGRAREVSEVRAWLGRTRLLTLTGLAGWAKLGWR
jgi:transcriptional regulator with XRE-family HTH domain